MLSFAIYLFILFSLFAIFIYKHGVEFSIFEKKPRTIIALHLGKGHLHTQLLLNGRQDPALYLHHPYKNCYISYQHVTGMPPKI